MLRSATKGLDNVLLTYDLFFFQTLYITFCRT